MSDHYIRLIPTDKHWQPSTDRAEAATTYVAGLFSGQDADVEYVEHEFYDHVTLIDAGENTTRISCSNCAEDIDASWFFELIGDVRALTAWTSACPAAERSSRWIRYVTTGRSALPNSR